jgi:hypothetical protein
VQDSSCRIRMFRGDQLGRLARLSYQRVHLNRQENSAIRGFANIGGLNYRIYEAFIGLRRTKKSCSPKTIGQQKF